MKHPTYMEELAGFVDAIHYDIVPSEVLDKVKLCIMDALECCLSPMQDERVVAALRSVPEREEGSTLILTGKKASAADAAFYNTVKGSVTNRNDLQLDSAVHAGAVIVPTVLSIAENRHLDGKTFIECVLAGYEATSRFGQFLSGRIHKAWRTTAVFSPVGCALAAAKAMGLDREGIADAGAISANSSSGFNEWAQSGTGEDVFQNGNGARNGIQSALLSYFGASGCRNVLEGESGLAAAFGIQDGYEKLTSEYFQRWAILRVIHKPIESCIIVQAPCQAAENLRKKFPELKVKDIQSVRIQMERRLIEHAGCSNKEIHSLVQAIMSIAFGVSSSLLSGNPDCINWMPPVSEDVKVLMDKCVFVPVEMGGSPLGSPVHLEVETMDGSVFIHEQKLVPLTAEDVKNRFLSTATKRLGEENARILFEKLEHLETVSDCAAITALMA